MSFWVRLPWASSKSLTLARDLDSALLIARHLRATSTPFKADLFVSVSDILQAVSECLRPHETDTYSSKERQISTFRSTMQTDIIPTGVLVSSSYMCEGIDFFSLPSYRISWIYVQFSSGQLACWYCLQIADTLLGYCRSQSVFDCHQDEKMWSMGMFRKVKSTLRVLYSNAYD